MEGIKPNRTAIAIVTYNTTSFLEKQIELILKYMKDDHTLIIVDNSDTKARKRIKEIVDNFATPYYKKGGMVIGYFKTHSDGLGNSHSHANACQDFWEVFKSKFDRILLLDHDIFPIEPFSMNYLLPYGIALSGRNQKRIGYNYFWPGFLAINCEEVKKNDIELDFDPTIREGVNLDTGGNLSYVVEKFLEKVNFVGCRPRIMFKGFPIDYICDNKFIHFRNGSNWLKIPLEIQNKKIEAFLNFIDKRDREEAKCQ